MTFLICWHGESYYMDIETMDDLFDLRDKYGYVKFDIDFDNMTITIH